MLKEDRQKALLDLLRKSSVSRQDEIVAALTDKGFAVTQASVSRDLNELGVVKDDGIYVARPRVSAREFGGLRLRLAGDNLIVGRCQPGMASAITVRIDTAGIEPIVGTIAGDDTIFIAVSGKKAQTAALKALDETFAGIEIIK